MPFGTPRIFHKKFKFIVEVDGVQSASFQKCSELSAEIAKIEHREGGVLLAQKSPGLVTVPDITLERGVTGDADLFNWFKAGVNLTSQLGLKEDVIKRSFDIVGLDRDGEELRRFTCGGAWVTKFVAGEWDNDADENLIEKVTLSIDWWDKSFG